MDVTSADALNEGGLGKRLIKYGNTSTYFPSFNDSGEKGEF